MCHISFASVVTLRGLKSVVVYTSIVLHYFPDKFGKIMSKKQSFLLYVHTCVCKNKTNRIQPLNFTHVLLPFSKKAHSFSEQPI